MKVEQQEDYTRSLDMFCNLSHNIIVQPGTPVETISLASNCTGSEFNLRSCDGYAVTSVSSCTGQGIISLECRGQQELGREYSVIPKTFSEILPPPPQPLPFFFLWVYVLNSLIA
jgi:hypothetical protein